MATDWGATGPRASERNKKSAPEKVSDREGFQRCSEVF